MLVNLSVAIWSFMLQQAEPTTNWSICEACGTA